MTARRITRGYVFSGQRLTVRFHDGTSVTGKNGGWGREIIRLHTGEGPQEYQLTTVAEVTTAAPAPAGA